MASREYNDIKKMLESLPTKEKKKLVAQIVGMLNTQKPDDSDRCSYMVREHTYKDRVPDCPRCKAKAGMGCIVKRGFKGGAQRYLCKTCGRYFVPTTNTVFEGTHKDAAVWEKFIELTLNCKSLKVCSEECQIAYQTAFNWRHKILNALKQHLANTMFTGNVEMDEMLIPISYKGNHIPGGLGEERTIKAFGGNNLPRKSFERGSDNKSTSSRTKACVFCMIKNGNEGFYAAVPGTGFMKPEMLEKTVGAHVDKDNSIVIVDQYKVTQNYLKDNGFNYMSLLSNTSDNPHDHKPEVRNGLHLQHVNALHHHLRRFLAQYSGVSSKYLEHYIALYIWLKNVDAIKQKRRTKKVTISRISHSDSYISRKQLEALPAVPCCA